MLNWTDEIPRPRIKSGAKGARNDKQKLCVLCVESPATRGACGSEAPGARSLKTALEFVHATHSGMVRSHNEDAIAISPDVGLAILADGMGGYNAGEVASRLASEFLLTHLEADLGEWRRELKRRGPEMLHALLQARIDGANAAIIEAADSEPKFYGMGTTLVMALFGDDVLTTIHLGDSRAYRLRDGTLTLLTRDHSLLQDQIDAGVLSADEARFSTNRNFVTRALGVDTQVDAEIADYELAMNDLYMLCSDGLSDMLADEEIRATLSAADREDGGSLDAVAQKLVQLANEHGGRDNVSVILVRVAAPGASRTSGAQRSVGSGKASGLASGASRTTRVAGLLDRLIKLRK